MIAIATVPRKNTAFRLDIEAVKAFKRLAKQANMSLPKYVEKVMVEHAKEKGAMSEDYEMLGETRGGDRTSEDSASESR